MKICVTGGAGFIGHHTVQALLTSGHEVLVVDNLSTGKANNLHPDVPLAVCDILDESGEDAISRFQPEAILHLAAKVTIRGSVETLSEDARQNFLGTAKVLESAIKTGVRRFILASSMAVYADAPTPQPIDEDWAKKPKSPYGISKLASEDLVHLMGERCGMSTMALRFFNTFGSGQAMTPYVGVITIFLNRILAGQPPVIFGDGEQCRDFVHVKDISKACLLALESNASGQSVNIGTGKGTTVNRIASMILNCLGSCLSPEFAPQRPEENRNSIADIRLAAELLGYQPQYALENSLDELLSQNQTILVSESRP